jgi:hypothetical protein
MLSPAAPGHGVVLVAHGVLVVDLLVHAHLALHVVVQAREAVVHRGAVHLRGLHLLDLLLALVSTHKHILCVITLLARLGSW